MKRMWSRNELVKQVKEVKKDITTLVDAQGHERFIEGDLALKEIEGVTKAFGKWSLSGSHLLIVLAINVANTTAFAGGSTTLVEDINVPDWIRAKIVPITGTLVDIKPVTFYASNWSDQSASFSLTKSAQNELLIRATNNITFTADRTGRIAFDLLIDND